jgi:hypothetical protein
MKLEEYEKKLTELELGNFPDFSQKMAELQAEYLSEQAVPDTEKAIALILDQATWRCTGDNFVVDVTAEDGEVNLMSV